MLDLIYNNHKYLKMNARLNYADEGYIQTMLLLDI